MLHRSVVLCVVLAGCASVTKQPASVDIKPPLPPAPRFLKLDVPPDLLLPSEDPRYQIPNLPEAGRTSKINAHTAVRIERMGDQRWLVVDLPYDKVWGTTRNFWLAQGGKLTSDLAQFGFMETDWFEGGIKKATAEEGSFLKRTLGQVFDGLFDDGVRDRFRTRIERSEKGTGVEVYITHRGMKESFTGKTKDHLVWEETSPDPQIEAEMLAKLMVFMGQDEATAQRLVKNAVAIPQKVDKASLENNQIVIVESFDRAWRRVGVALDRAGLSVQDRDRAKGVYLLSIGGAHAAATASPGFFSRILSSQPAQKNAEGVDVAQAKASVLRIELRGDEAKGRTVVTVSGEDKSTSPQTILQRIFENLR